MILERYPFRPGSISKLLPRHSDLVPAGFRGRSCVTIPSQFIEQDGGGNALEPPTHPSTAASKSRATPRRSASRMNPESGYGIGVQTFPGFDLLPTLVTSFPESA